jgi:hypothetical protein
MENDCVVAERINLQSRDRRDDLIRIPLRITNEKPETEDGARLSIVVRDAVPDSSMYAIKGICES